MSPRLCDSKDLNEFSAYVEGSGDLAVDCEFVRERTFWPQLGLLQFAAGGRILLLDPLSLADPQPLLMLFHRARRVLMHAPGEDLECLLHHYGFAPHSLFDTQLAAAFVGRGSGLGYRALVQQIAGVDLDKGETRSDWLRRPLSAAQLRYAAADVEHLQQVAEVLGAELQAQGKQDWFNEDCQLAIRKARALQAEPDGRLEPRQIARLSDREARRLQRILLWRERVAREHDRPKSWLLDNETAQRLAGLADADRSAHEALFRETRRAASFAADDLWALLQSPPDPALPPLPARPPEPDSAYKRRFAALQAKVAAIAERHTLPAPLLFPRRMIEALLDGGRWPEGVGSWRETLLSEPLLALLDG